MMPRSSSGEFHAVSRPWVPVNTPPSGGPTSSPKMSVTPSRDSPTCSAMRIAWIIVAMSRLPADQVAVGEHVVPHRARRGMRLGPHALARLGELLGIGLAQLVHVRAGQQLAILEHPLEALDAVDLA